MQQFIMEEYLKFLAIICSRLDSVNLKYMVSGSMAFAFYATPRMTRDIDIIIEITSADIDKLLSLFQSGFYFDKETIDYAIRHQEMFNVIHEQTIIKLDFIVRKDDSYRQLEFSRRRATELHGQTIYLVAPEDLILSKLVWAKDSQSELQMRDVKQLLIARKDLDIAYLEKWADYLQVSELLVEAKENA